MDIFIEQLVTKKSDTTDILKKVGLAVLTVILSLVLFFVSSYFGLGSIGLILIIGVIYGAFYLITGMNVEYEYIVTNGEIDIDKIIAKRRRKRLITFKVSAFENFGPLKEAPSSFSGTTILATGASDGENYFAEFPHAKHGHVRLVFSPNERVLSAIRPYMPRTIRLTERH